MEPLFASCDDSDLAGLAHSISDSLTRLKGIFGDFDYNLVIDSVPRDYVGGTYLWNVRILPRLDQVSGFEMSTGISVNTTFPEVAAQQLRDVNLTTVHHRCEMLAADI